MEPPDDNLDLPQNLKAALRGLYGPAAPFRGDDTRILTAARAAGTPQTGRWRWAVGMGIAAAVALAATLYTVVRPPGERHSAVAVTYVKTGDIRDAFFVARQLKAHQALEATWDANGDGIVDEKDCRVLAAAAVSLSPKGVTQ